MIRWKEVFGGASSTHHHKQSVRKCSRLLAFLVILHVIQVCECLGGVFELKIREFSNPSGRDMDGNCCTNTNNNARVNHRSSVSALSAPSDSLNIISSENSNECAGLCTTKFRVCVKHYQVTIDHTPPCTFGEASTSELFGDKTINQDFKFPFNFRWPGTFSLIIEAWHHNSPAVAPSGSSNRNHNDTRARLVSRMGIQQYLDVGEEWRPREWTGNEGQVSLSYEYRVTCLPDYYGDACDKTCRPRNDTFGHYTCSEQGDKICLPGWTGSYCEKPICRPGCQGTCTVPDTCECHSGWEGDYCTECVRYPGCKHGRCTNPWECNCEEGWGGLFCNQDLNYCTNHKPCRNGGTCFNTGQGSYTCSCPVGFIGADCETRADGCTCLNGGTCRENGTATFCQCPEGWSGLNCEVASFTCDTIPSPCANGGTCSEDPSSGQANCVCAPGYGGVRCETQISDNFCLCKNGGTCTSTGDCICVSGFYGPKCSSTSPQDAIANVCSNVVCSNGGTCVPNKVAQNTPPYSCSCPLGWTGDFCTIPVNICTTLPCANGGTCTPLPESKYKCECPRHFGGPDCSEPCDCENGGTCEIANVCNCPKGFGGSKCQVVTNTTTILTLGQRSAEEEITTGRLVAVICVSVSTPLLVVIAVAVLLALKKRRRAEQNRNDELARKQNEQNTLHSVTKKCFDQHMIVNTFEDGGSGSRTSNKCSNLDLSFKADHVQNTKNYKCAAEFNRNNSNSNVNCAVDASCSSGYTSDSKADVYAPDPSPLPAYHPQYQGCPPAPQQSAGTQGGIQPPPTSLLRQNPTRYSTYSYQLAPSSASSLHQHVHFPHHLSTSALRNSLLMNSSSSADTSPASSACSASPAYSCNSNINNLNKTANNSNSNSPVINHSIDSKNNNLATEV